MATFRAQCVFPFYTNLPSDVWTNTLHFTELTPLGLTAAADALTPALSAFYDSIYTEMGGMANYCTSINRHVNWYNLDDPPPRVPYTLPLDVTVPAGATNIPTECAIVLSFQALAESGQPQTRRRGRIYLGALTEAAITTSAAGSSFPMINSALRTAIGNYAEILRDASSTASCRWSVFSPTTGESHFVDNGWVDNTPDTQRRRGVAASARTLWS